MRIVTITQILEKTDAITKDDGELVFRFIRDGVKHYDKTLIDFTGVDLMTTIFLRESVGRIYEYIPIDEVDNKIIIESSTLRTSQQKMIEHILRNKPIDNKIYNEIMNS